MTQLNRDSRGPQTLPIVRRIAARLLTLVVRILSWTWFVRREGVDAAPISDSIGSAVYAFWHGEQLIMIPLHARKGVIGMASHSSDGAFLAKVIELLGYGVVRGSSSRGGSEALQQCVDKLNSNHSIGIAVDGPRGPRHVARHGAAVMAVRSRRPIVCVRAQVWPRIRLKSWDRFEIPLPFARVRIRYTVVRPISGEEWDVAQLQEALQACLARDLKP